jgi:hypothetical protein
LGFDENKDGAGKDWESIKLSAGRSIDKNYDLWRKTSV